MSSNRRLDVNVNANIAEHQRLEAEARLYTRLRNDYILQVAQRNGIGLTPVEQTDLYNIADGKSQGVFDVFKTEADREIADFKAEHPEKVRYSALNDWVGEMDDKTKARREIASWLDNPKIAYFDTETTGLDDTNVPFSAAASDHDGKPLCVIQMLTLDANGELINISPEASRITGVSMEVIHQYMALEDDEHAVKELENLMNGGYILTGYNTQFDRGMICRALMYANRRTAKSPTKNEVSVKRLADLHKYFNDPSHWLETKDTFVTAIGLDPRDTPGRRTRLQDVARATRALTFEENQEHGALADCQLIAKIVQNIRKEIEETMSPKPKTAAKGPFPPAANPADNEPAQEPQPEIYTDELKAYTEGLETSLNELQAKFESSEAERERLFNRNAELQAACEQYANTDGVHRHSEARDVTWNDVEINGFRFNFTRREGETVEQSLDAIFDHVRVLQAVKADDRVKTFRVGMRDNWKDLKGFEKSSNGKPADDQPPADEKPATPKNTPPTANKPNTPPPAKPASQPQQPGGQQPTGKVQGAKASQLYTGLTRHQIDGQNTYDLSFILNNGKPADKPIPVSKRDTPALEKALADVGWTPESFDLGVSYDVKIMNEWTWGKPTNADKPDGPRFHDNATFTVQTDEPF